MYYASLKLPLLVIFESVQLPVPCQQKNQHPTLCYLVYFKQIVNLCPLQSAKSKCLKLGLFSGFQT